MRPERLNLLRLTALLLALSLGLAQTAPRSADQWYAQGQGQLKAQQYPQAAASFEQAVRLNPSAANWRWLAEASVLAGDTERASQAYAEAVRLYRAKNDPVTAQALENRAAQFRQDASFYLLDQPASTLGPACATKRAKFEPVSGLLMGMYVDEQGIGSDGRFNVASLPAENFAVYFRYFSWRSPVTSSGEALFPARFARAARLAGAAIHLAVEPDFPLQDVTEASILPLARAAKDAGVPIFLRFAGEFNDPANAWSRDPALYRAKFRLVHDVMARVAPNVAMVWMPMPSRLDIIDAYFPGDDAVDWVGISLYSVPFRNGVANDSTQNVNPLDVLRPFYDKYACQHPFQISEYGASHRSLAAPQQDFTAFSVQKLRTLFWGAAMQFPRLKNINWLNLDMTTSAFTQAKIAERRNDYYLQDSPAKLAAYREVLAQPYFQTRFQDALKMARPAPFPAAVPSGNLRGAVLLSTPAAPSRVNLRLDGQPITVQQELPYMFSLSAAQLTPGSHTLSFSALGQSGRVLLEKKQTFTVQR